MKTSHVLVFGAAALALLWWVNGRQARADAAASVSPWVRPTYPGITFPSKPRQLWA